MLRLLVVALAMLGCGGGEDVPSCQQAMTHYYDSGCVFRDASGNVITVEAITVACKQDLVNLPASCSGEFDDLLICLHETPTPVTKDSDCDCTVEQDAVLTCQ